MEEESREEESREEENDFYYDDYIDTDNLTIVESIAVGIAIGLVDAAFRICSRRKSKE